jgi:hypothetical protein
MTLIIRDGKTLTKAVSKFAKNHGAYRSASEALAWEVLSHTAQYGDCSILKKFYAGLDQAWMRAFNYWIGEQITNSDYAFIDPETEKAVRWITLRDGEFTVRKGAEAARHHWLAQVVADDSRIGFLSMPKRDSDTAGSTFDNMKLMEEFKKLAKRAGRDTSDVSAKIIAVLSEAESKIEKIISTIGVKVVTTSVEEEKGDKLDQFDLDHMREANLIAA